MAGWGIVDPGNHVYTGRMRRTDLCERGLVDAVDVRLGLLLDVISEGFVTDGAVDQRLHERTRTKQHKGESEQALDLHSRI